MPKSNPVREKSYAFALEIIACSRTLIQRKEYVLSKQLLRSGTSIGANIEEALQGQSKPDFISKLSIALKEACETRYWLRLLTDSATLSTKESSDLQAKLSEILRLLTAILKTSKTT